MAATLAGGCFLGQVLLRRRFPGVVLTQTRHPRRGWLPVHSHENAYFCLVRRGQFAERFGSSERLCKPMMLVFHPPQERHSEKIESECATSFNVELEGEFLRAARAVAEIPLEPREIDSPQAANVALRLQNEFEQSDNASTLAIQGLALELLAALARGRAAGKAVPGWLSLVRDVLHDRFREPLELAELARAAGVHPVYLIQGFRKHFQCTPGEYLRRLRVEWAKEQLLRADLSLTEIAYRAGFSDQSHLTRLFKRQTGQTPAAFRRSAGSAARTS
jgi:AraC family transcriptional regulator